MSDTRDIRARIVRIGVTHRRVATIAGYDPTLFSKHLSRDRPPPPDFNERVTKALDVLETAELAADEARRRVLQRAGVAS